MVVVKCFNLNVFSIKNLFLPEIQGV